jgi:hypothetical protein
MNSRTANFAVPICSDNRDRTRSADIASPIPYILNEINDVTQMVMAENSALNQGRFLGSLKCALNRHSLWSFSSRVTLASGLGVLPMFRSVRFCEVSLLIRRDQTVVEKLAQFVRKAGNA